MIFVIISILDRNASPGAEHASFTTVLKVQNCADHTPLCSNAYER